MLSSGRNQVHLFATAITIDEKFFGHIFILEYPRFMLAFLGMANQI